MRVSEGELMYLNQLQFSCSLKAWVDPTVILYSLLRQLAHVRDEGGGLGEICSQTHLCLLWPNAEFAYRSLEEVVFSSILQ